MTVGRALARGKLAAARRRAKYARQVWAVFHGPPCHHVRLTPTVLAFYNDATKYVNASISALPPGEMFKLINS